MFRQCIKKQRNHFTDKGPYSQSCGFPSSLIRMWELDHKQGWGPKNWGFWSVVLEKTLRSSLDTKEIKSVNPKVNQAWIFIGRLDAEGEARLFRAPDANSQLIGSFRVDAGTSGFIYISDSDRTVPAELGNESQAFSCVDKNCKLKCLWGQTTNVNEHSSLGME